MNTMVDLHYFTPLIGKRFGTPEFGAAIEQLEKETGETLSCEIISVSNPIERLYEKEQILAISSGDRVLTTYRAYAPYDDKTDKYPEGDAHYIMPRYKLTADFDKSLTSYLIYYLSITAHRYLEVIKSFYATPEGAELDYEKDKLIDETKTKLKELLQLKNAFGRKNDPEGELKNQKKSCKKRYKSLLHNLTNIIIRRAEPFTTTDIDAVIAKAFMPFSPNSDGEIRGPNEEMEIIIRYNILALKLIVHDFNLLNGKSVNPAEQAADRKEFDSLNYYLMVDAKFIPTKSDGKIIEPSQAQLEEFSRVMHEVHGEIGKVGGVLMWVETPKRTSEQALARREISGYAMLDNRIQKITRCAYYIDSAHTVISSTIRGRDELKEAVQEFIDVAKLKVFTSAGSSKFTEICEKFTEKVTALTNLTNSPETHLKPTQQSALTEFISVVSSMTETKRRQEDSIEKIRNAGAVNQR